MTSAEIMRQQMRVTEHGDARLRKTLMRTLVGQWYGNGGTGTGTAALECALSLALGAGKIIAESVHTDHECGGDRVDYYIRCSMRSAFTKVLESGLGQEHGMLSGHQRDVDDTSGILTQLAKDTEELAQWERECFSRELRRWHPFPAAVAAVTLHGCYGVVLKQYLGKAVCLTDELVRVLHAAGRLEKALVQMVADDDGEPVVREVVPYDVESVVVGFLRTWVEERLRVARECLLRAKDTESWTARSKNEPYAQSAVDLMKLAKATLDEFFAIPVSARDGMLQDLADGLGAVFQDYVSFLASCGNKQSYLPPLPALTSRLLAAPCCHFDHARTAAQTAIAHVAEVAAYRLIFFDSHHSFYDGLYAGGVADARIRPALRTLKQNLSLLVSILVDRAQPVAVREGMKASFQAFLMVLLAGGNHRSFTREDHGMVEEDLRSLKRAFCTRGEGLVAEDVVESEAEAAEGVVALMGQTAERGVGRRSSATPTGAACGGSPRAALPMPLTTRRWCRTDPDTILRVLCHRDDEAASQFLKRAFQLPKRR
uniref:MHD1 domain-containing protein n=1 Tax=Aegilops tauschii TaxID=37682 RepID=M8D660_AEGTA